VPYSTRGIIGVLISFSMVVEPIGMDRPLSPWHMASATPYLRLPSQPQSVTALWPVPNYVIWWTEAHVCEQLAQDCYLAVHWARVEPANSLSPVRHAVLNELLIWLIRESFLNWCNLQKIILGNKIFCCQRVVCRTVCDTDLEAVASCCIMMEQLDILGTREVSPTAVQRYTQIFLLTTLLMSYINS